MKTILFLLFSFASVKLFASDAPSGRFESLGRKIDQKVDEASKESKALKDQAAKELRQRQSQVDEAADKAAREAKAKRDDWTSRAWAAAHELNQGVQRAWSRIKGERDGG